MKERVTFYDRATGKITGQRRIDFARGALVPHDRGMVFGRVDDGKHYVDPATGEPVPLKQFDVTIEPGRITGIPSGSWAIVDTERVPSAPGTIENGELLLPPGEVDAVVTLQCPLHDPLVKIRVPRAPATEEGQ